MWQSFGFLSAIEKARLDLIEFSTEVESNPRVGIMQLFGSSSGFVVSHAALGSNVCDLALIPELPFRMSDVCDYVGQQLSARLNSSRSPHALIAMAETAIPVDYKDYLDKAGLTDGEKKELSQFEQSKRSLLGQTPDALRTAGLKIVSRVLQDFIWNDMGAREKYWKRFRVVTNEPRHLIRSMAPTANDVAYGVRLGTMAVDMAMAGFTDCMISHWLTEYVAVPLKLVVLGRKQVPRNGIFWKTVVGKTGQIRTQGLV